MDWLDVLRLLSAAGMAYGAWLSYKNLPPKFVHDGRTYYRNKDGRFSTRWGRLIKDPALIGALEASWSNRAKA
jgi:hypothetical protein